MVLVLIQLFSHKMVYKNFKISYKFCKWYSNIPFSFSKIKNEYNSVYLRVWLSQYWHRSHLGHLCHHRPPPKGLWLYSQQWCLGICCQQKPWSYSDTGGPLWETPFCMFPIQKIQLTASQSTYSQFQPLRTTTGIRTCLALLSMISRQMP